MNDAHDKRFSDISSDPPRRPIDNVFPRLQPEEASFVLDEVADLRTMVQRGDVLVLAGGATMAWWGLCLAANWAAWTVIALGYVSPDAAPWNLLFIAAGYIGNFALGFLRPTRVPMLPSWRTQAISTTWLFAGAGIILISLGRDLTHHGDENAFGAFCAVLFSVVLAVMASSGKRPWLFLAAGGWMVTAAAMFVLPSVVVLRSVLCLAFMVFMAVPGLVLARTEREAVR